MSGFASCALAEQPELARLCATGPDFLGLLHRLSTNDVCGLAPGEGRPTVLTSPKGRIVERLFVHHLGGAGVLTIAGPGSGPRVVEHVRRFTFAERTELREISDATRYWALVGSRAAEALAAAGLEPPAPYGVVRGEVARFEVHVLGQDGSSAEGFSILAALDGADAIAAELAASVAAVGGAAVDREALEVRRVLRGIPAPGRELTEDYNPLEAGLWDAVSFDKGCYVGQEVVARLRTYDKVARMLVGVELSASDELPAPGTPLVLAGRPIGTLTSAVRVPGRERAVGLGYVKRRDRPADGAVRLGAGPAAARLVDLPFE